MRYLGVDLDTDGLNMAQLADVVGKLKGQRVTAKMLYIQSLYHNPRGCVSVSVAVSVSVSLSVSVSVSLSLSVSVSVSVSACLPVCLSACVSMCYIYVARRTGYTVARMKELLAFCAEHSILILNDGESTALSPLPLISSYKSEKSLCGAEAYYGLHLTDELPTYLSVVAAEMGLAAGVTPPPRLRARQSPCSLAIHLAVI